MALIKCPECGKDISDRAIQCPGCGHYVVNANKDISNNNNDIDVQVIETNSNSKGLQVFSDEKSISIKISITTLIAICVAVISVILMVVSFVYIGGYKKALNGLMTVSNDNISTEMNNEGTGVEKKDSMSIPKRGNDTQDDSTLIDEETEENVVGKSVPSGKNDNKNIIFSDDYVVDMDFEFTRIGIDNHSLVIYYKVTNNEEFPIEIHSQRMLYLDDTAVQVGYSNILNPIAPGKSAICYIRIRDSQAPVKEKHVDTLTLEMSIVDEDEEYHCFEVIFEDVTLGI